MDTNNDFLGFHAEREREREKRDKESSSSLSFSRLRSTLCMGGIRDLPVTSILHRWSGGLGSFPKRDGGEGRRYRLYFGDEIATKTTMPRTGTYSAHFSKIIKVTFTFLVFHFVETRRDRMTVLAKKTGGRGGRRGLPNLLLLLLSSLLFFHFIPLACSSRVQRRRRRRQFCDSWPPPNLTELSWEM